MVDLSIIIPMYKGKAYIKKTVSEVLKIECTKEVLIIDDGSPDYSFDYANKCWNENAEVKVYKKDNGGIADARNYGLIKAGGNFILFVDQDDRINPVTITSAVKKMNESDFAAIMWTTMFEYEDNTCKICDKVFADKIANKDDIREKIIPAMLSRVACEYTTYAGHIWGGLFRRNIVENNQIRLKKFIDYEDDLLFVFDFLLQSKKILFIKDIGYYWLTNRQSYSHEFNYVENFIGKSEKYREYLKSEYERIVCHPIKEDVQQYFKQYTIVSAIKNACGKGNRGKVDIRDIENKINDNVYKKAIVSPNNYVIDAREWLSLMFARYGLISHAVKLARLYYLIRRKVRGC